jgi:hypothetical protein
VRRRHTGNNPTNTNNKGNNNEVNVVRMKQVMLDRPHRTTKRT